MQNDLQHEINYSPELLIEYFNSEFDLYNDFNDQITTNTNVWENDKIIELVNSNEFYFSLDNGMNLSEFGQTFKLFAYIDDNLAENGFWSDIIDLSNVTNSLNVNGEGVNETDSVVGYLPEEIQNSISNNLNFITNGRSNPFIIWINPLNPEILNNFETEFFSFFELRNEIDISSFDEPRAYLHSLENDIITKINTVGIGSIQFQLRSFESKFDALDHKYENLLNIVFSMLFFITITFISIYHLRIKTWLLSNQNNFDELLLRGLIEKDLQKLLLIVGSTYQVIIFILSLIVVFLLNILNIFQLLYGLVTVLLIGYSIIILLLNIQSIYIDNDWKGKDNPSNGVDIISKISLSVAFLLIFLQQNFGISVIFIIIGVGPIVINYALDKNTKDFIVKTKKDLGKSIYNLSLKKNKTFVVLTIYMIISIFLFNALFYGSVTNGVIENNYEVGGDIGISVSIPWEILPPSNEASHFNIMELPGSLDESTILDVTRVEIFFINFTQLFEFSLINPELSDFDELSNTELNYLNSRIFHINYPALSGLSYEINFSYNLTEYSLNEQLRDLNYRLPGLNILRETTNTQNPAIIVPLNKVVTTGLPINEFIMDTTSYYGINFFEEDDKDIFIDLYLRYYNTEYLWVSYEIFTNTDLVFSNEQLSDDIKFSRILFIVFMIIIIPLYILLTVNVIHQLVHEYRSKSKPVIKRGFQVGQYIKINLLNFYLYILILLTILLSVTYYLIIWLFKITLNTNDSAPWSIGEILFLTFVFHFPLIIHLIFYNSRDDSFRNY